VKKVVEVTSDDLWDPSLVENKTKEELLDLKIRVDEAVHKVNNQLLDARTTWSTTGQYADRDWYRRATNAVASYKRQGQRIQAELSRLTLRKKQSNLDKDHEWHRVFQKVAYELLPTEQYEMVRKATNLKAGDRGHQ
jgi:hypothetical protein